jgi:adenylate kinase family enzyme
MQNSDKKEDNLIKGNASDIVRDFFNVGKIKRAFRVGSDIFSAAHPFIEKPTTLNAVKSLFFIGKVIVDDMEVWPDDYFGDEWEPPYPEDFNKIILKAVSKKPYKVIKTSDESLSVHMVQLDGNVRLGYVINTKNDYIDKLFVETKHLERARRIIKNDLWALLKDDNIVLRRAGKHKNEDGVSLEADDDFISMPSKRAHEYSMYLKKCIDAGVSRSVLLYGPPGTGKSTMARTIVSSLGLRSFRIRVEDVGYIETSTLFESINIFEPDAVIIDDFDRSTEQSAMLEILEYFQRHVKLVVATVNNRNRLDEAILRPGRFDELLHVKQMDDDVVKAVLGDDHASSFDIVKDWPIAFIQEFVKRRRFMSTEEAEASVKELAHRVKRLKQFEDDEEDAAMESLLIENEAKVSRRNDLVLKEIFDATKKRRRNRKNL